MYFLAPPRSYGIGVWNKKCTRILFFGISRRNVYPIRCIPSCWPRNCGEQWWEMNFIYFINIPVAVLQWKFENFSRADILPFSSNLCVTKIFTLWLEIFFFSYLFFLSAAQLPLAISQLLEKSIFFFLKSEFWFIFKNKEKCMPGVPTQTGN